MTKLGETDHVWIKDLQDNDQIEGLYVVTQKKTGVTRKGDPFLSMVLADCTGEIEARVWDNATEVGSLFSEGDVVKVKGTVTTYKDQIQLVISSLEPWKEKVDASMFIESTPKDVGEMLTSLINLLKDVSDAHLKRLIQRFIADRDFVEGFKLAPAAKHFHHNYLGGLLEHTLSVCQLANSVSKHYTELDRDLLVTGAFLHDIGKLRELSHDLRIEYTDEGRLVGHLVLGCLMMEEKISQIKGFPPDLAIRLKHLILSHHGQFEFGSPKRPKFKEAFALHLIDDLDAKMNGLGRFIEMDRKEGAWTEYNRLFERYFLKGSIEIARLTDQPNDKTEEGEQERLFEV